MCLLSTRAYGGVDTGSNLQQLIPSLLPSRNSLSPHYSRKRKKEGCRSREKGGGKKTKNEMREEERKWHERANKGTRFGRGSGGVTLRSPAFPCPTCCSVPKFSGYCHPHPLFPEPVPNEAFTSLSEFCTQHSSSKRK